MGDEVRKTETSKVYRGHVSHCEDLGFYNVSFLQCIGKTLRMIIKEWSDLCFSKVTRVAVSGQEDDKSGRVGKVEGVAVTQEWAVVANSLCKGTNSKYLQLCRPITTPGILAQQKVATDHTPIVITTFQANFIYEQIFEFHKIFMLHIILLLIFFSNHFKM